MKRSINFNISIGIHYICYVLLQLLVKGTNEILVRINKITKAKLLKNGRIDGFLFMFVVLIIAIIYIHAYRFFSIYSILQC